MGHKSLVNSTTYEVIGGKTIVGGATYEITEGRTLIGGTGYTIGFLNGLIVYNSGDSVELGDIGYRTRINNFQYGQAIGYSEQIESGSTEYSQIKDGAIQLSYGANAFDVYVQTLRGMMTISNVGFDGYTTLHVETYMSDDISTAKIGYANVLGSGGSYNTGLIGVVDIQGNNLTEYTIDISNASYFAHIVMYQDTGDGTAYITKIWLT